jgi:hypothetical protein
MFSNQALDFVADSANPLLGISLLASIFVRFSTAKQARPFVIRSASAIAITYILSHLHDWFDLWKASGDFPSGHMTFFLTLVMCYAYLDRRSLWITVPAAFSYGTLIVYLNYHTWFDLWVSIFVAVPVTWACFRMSIWKKESGF